MTEIDLEAIKAERARLEARLGDAVDEEVHARRRLVGHLAVYGLGDGGRHGRAREQLLARLLVLLLLRFRVALLRLGGLPIVLELLAALALLRLARLGVGDQLVLVARCVLELLDARLGIGELRRQWTVRRDCFL